MKCQYDRSNPLLHLTENYEGFEDCDWQWQIPEQTRKRRPRSLLQLRQNLEIGLPRRDQSNRSAPVGLEQTGHNASEGQSVLDKKMHGIIWNATDTGDDTNGRGVRMYMKDCMQTATFFDRRWANRSLRVLTSFAFYLDWRPESTKLSFWNLVTENLARRGTDCDGLKDVFWDDCIFNILLDLRSNLHSFI